MTYKVSVMIEKDEYGYYAYAPELQGCQTQGDTVDEILVHDGVNRPSVWLLVPTLQRGNLVSTPPRPLHRTRRRSVHTAFPRRSVGTSKTIGLFPPSWTSLIPNSCFLILCGIKREPALFRAPVLFYGEEGGI